VTGAKLFLPLWRIGAGLRSFPDRRGAD